MGTAGPATLCLIVACTASGCDRSVINDRPSDDAAAAKQPAEPARAGQEPAKVDPGPSPADPPAKQTRTAIEPAPGAFSKLVAHRLAVASEVPGSEPGKRAWAHYKAKRYPEAIPLFGAAAIARPKDYKPAFNMACAAALGGELDVGRIALTEALSRDRAKVVKKARRDADLEALRKAEWFAALLADTPAEPAPVVAAPKPVVTAPKRRDSTLPGQPKAGPVVPESEETLVQTWYAKNCDDLDMTTTEPRCWDEFLLGDYGFEALSFTTPIPVPELPDPGAMPKSRWRRVKAKFNFKAIGAAIGAKGVYGLDPDKCAIITDPLPEIYDIDCPWTRPGFWWAADDQVFLIIPHTWRRRPVTARSITIARRVGDQWLATTIDPVIDERFHSHLIGGGSYELNSGPLLRGDGREFWVFARGVGGDEELPNLCRVRWSGAELESGCREDWTHEFTGAG